MPVHSIGCCSEDKSYVHTTSTSRGFERSLGHSGRRVAAFIPACSRCHYHVGRRLLPHRRGHHAATGQGTSQQQVAGYHENEQHGDQRGCTLHEWGHPAPPRCPCRFRRHGNRKYTGDRDRGQLLSPLDSLPQRVQLPLARWAFSQMLLHQQPLASHKLPIQVGGQLLLNVAVFVSPVFCRQTQDQQPFSIDCGLSRYPASLRR